MTTVTLYSLVRTLIPSWLLWLLMVAAGVQWLVWWRRGISCRINALDLGGMVAPLLPWMISYALIFYEDAIGVPTDTLRGVALSRLSLAWMLLGLNVLLLRPLRRNRRYMNRDCKRLD